MPSGTWLPGDEERLIGEVEILGLAVFIGDRHARTDRGRRHRRGIGKAGAAIETKRADFTCWAAKAVAPNSALPAKAAGERQQGHAGEGFQDLAAGRLGGVQHACGSLEAGLKRMSER